MNEIIEHAEINVPAVVSEAASLMQVISRAAADPQTDVNKLDKLLSMYERITAGRAKSEFDAALSAMQPKLPTVNRNGNITIKDKGTEIVRQSTPYALFEDINEAVRPVLNEFGFAISFRTGTAADGKIVVTAILSHKGGHREETSLSLAHDSTGSKNAVQAIGSSVSYGKRYTMCAMLNITTKGEDDDAQAADEFITDDQEVELLALIKETKTDTVRFLDHMGVKALTSIPGAQFKKAKHALQAKQNKGGRS